MESKYIEATKRYYEELEKISMPTPIEKTARALFLSISEEIQECFSIEQCNPEKYDRFYTLLLSLLDFDFQALFDYIASFTPPTNGGRITFPDKPIEMFGKGLYQ